MLTNVYQTLDDCKRSLQLLEDVSDDEQLFRIYYISCVVLIRNINDSLKNASLSDSSLKAYLKKRREKIGKDYEEDSKKRPFFTECSLDYLIYYRLTRKLRNDVAHGNITNFLKSEFCAPIGVIIDDVLDEDSIYSDIDVYHPMGDVDYWGNWDCRDWIHEAIIWWEQELKKIETFLEAK